MEGDEENIDAAQVQGQVLGAVIAADEKAGHFEKLVGHDKGRQGFAPAAAAHGAAVAVAEAAQHRKGRKNRQPAKVQAAIVGKACTGGDGFHGIKKVWHRRSSFSFRKLCFIIAALYRAYKNL